MVKKSVEQTTVREQKLINYKEWDSNNSLLHNKKVKFYYIDKLINWCSYIWKYNL